MDIKKKKEGKDAHQGKERNRVSIHPSIHQRLKRRAEACSSPDPQWQRARRAELHLREGARRCNTREEEEAGSTLGITHLDKYLLKMTIYLVSIILMLTFFSFRQFIPK